MMTIVTFSTCTRRITDSFPNSSLGKQTLQHCLVWYLLWVFKGSQSTTWDTPKKRHKNLVSQCLGRNRIKARAAIFGAV